MEVDKFIKDESRETDTRDKRVTDIRIGGINEKLALEIALKQFIYGTTLVVV